MMAFDSAVLACLVLADWAPSGKEAKAEMGPMSMFNASGCRSIADAMDPDTQPEQSQEELKATLAPEHGFFRKLMGTNVPSASTDQADAASKKDKRSFSGASKSTVPKKVMDVLGPLLLSKGKALHASKPSNGSGLPIAGVVANQDSKKVLNRAMSASSGLTEYVNKMHLSDTMAGKRAKQVPQEPATATSERTSAPQPTAPRPAPSSLDRLLEQARYCNLPVSPRGPETGVPSASLHSPSSTSAAYPTTMLSMSATVPPRMHRAKWSLDDYVINEKLYTGYASTVYKATCLRSGDIVVLKIYTLSAVCDLYKYQIYREIRVHSNLQHENIVHLYASFQQGEKVVLVQEYADGSDLFNMLHKYGGRLSERLAVQMVLEPFLRVLQYLHTRGIIHRDIKPENIMFTKSMCLKLGDFGLAIDLREERAVTRAGTLDYMAPEVLRCPFKSRPTENKDNVRLHYSNRVDSWAVGVLTYELVVGFPPFFDQSRTGTEDRIMTSVPAFPANISEEAKNFVCASLSKAPADRPTILELLNHTWVDSYRTRRSMRNMQQVPLVAGAAVQAPGVHALSVGPPPLLVKSASTRPAAHVLQPVPSRPAVAALPTGLSSILSNISEDARQHHSAAAGRSMCAEEHKVMPGGTLGMENSSSSISSDGSVYMQATCEKVAHLHPVSGARAAHSVLC